jgi:hypothetical protein
MQVRSAIPQVWIATFPMAYVLNGMEIAVKGVWAVSSGVSLYLIWRLIRRKRR